MYSMLVKYLAFLKLQPWVKRGQDYSKTKDGSFGLITHGGSSFKPVSNLQNFQRQNNVIINKGKCGMTKTSLKRPWHVRIERI